MTPRSPIRSLAAALACAVALAGLNACSSGGSGGDDAAPPTTKWDAAAIARVQDVGARIKAADPSACTDLTFYPAAEYANASLRVGRPNPAAVGSCQGFGNDLEIAAFKTPTKRAAFVTGYTAALCRRAKDLKGEKPFPGLPFVVSDDYSIQPDGEPAGRRVAGLLGAKYHFERCPGIKDVGWDDARAATTQKVASAVASAGLGCGDFLLLDKETVRPLTAYQPAAAGLPAALGRCTIGTPEGGAEIAAFESAAAQRKFVAAEGADRCRQGAQGVVVGDGWALFLHDAALAPQVATATGGKVAGTVCG